MVDFIDSFREYWPGYGLYTYDTPVEVPGSIPSKLFDSCGIIHNVGPSEGGNLKGVDIKNMDANSILKMSLMESFAKGGDFLLEPVTNEYGIVELVEVGKEQSNLADIYHRIPTSNYISYETVVKITGKKRRPIRRIGSAVTLTDSETFGAKIWDTSYMATGCELSEMKKHATITFKDPHIEYTSNEGVDSSVYEAEWPWERVIGWVYYLDPQYDKAVPEYNSTTVTEDVLRDNVKIYFKKQSSVPFLLSGASNITGLPDPNQTEETMPYLGTLKRRIYHPGVGSVYSPCFEDLTSDYTCADGGLNIDIPFDIRYELIRNTYIDKLLDVAKIYFIGQELEICQPYPKEAAFLSAEEGRNPENWELWLNMNRWLPRYITLDEGTDYAIARDADGTTCIQFIDNTPFENVVAYGKNTPYKISSASSYYYYDLENNTLDPEIENKSGKGTIFPRFNGSGILVQQVWAQLNLDMPCLVVQDPFGKANLIAANVICQMAPIILKDEAAPIAIDGELLNLAEVFRSQDSDPTTIQYFDETDYEKILNSMDGKNVVELNMSTLDATETVELSSRLKEILENDRLKDINISYVCGPTTEPKLGEIGPEGGIINSISYNYSDSGSYTISVNEGPYVVPGSMSGITGDYYNKATETLSQASGTVIQDYGNHMIYKVLVDGFGVVDEAVSGTAKIIRKGDRVSVTIHNVPVEG